MKAPKRGILLALAAVMCSAGVGLAATFTWTGDGSDDDWDTAENWTISGIAQTTHPTANDDASLPTAASTWSVDLITVTMDHFTILDDVNFDTAGGTTTLTV